MLADFITYEHYEKLKETGELSRPKSTVETWIRETRYVFIRKFERNATLWETFKCLANRVKKHGLAYIYVESIAELVKKSVRSVQRAIAALEQMGLFKRVAVLDENGGNTHNVYVPQIPDLFAYNDTPTVTPGDTPQMTPPQVPDNPQPVRDDSTKNDAMLISFESSDKTKDKQNKDYNNNVVDESADPLQSIFDTWTKPDVQTDLCHVTKIICGDQINAAAVKKANRATFIKYRLKLIRTSISAYYASTLQNILDDIQEKQRPKTRDDLLRGFYDNPDLTPAKIGILEKFIKAGLK